jgi:hypothetical protein
LGKSLNNQDLRIDCSEFEAINSWIDTITSLLSLEAYRQKKMCNCYHLALSSGCFPFEV